MFVYLGEGDPREQEKMKLRRYGILETCCTCGGEGEVPKMRGFPKEGKIKCPTCKGRGERMDI